MSLAESPSRRGDLPPGASGTSSDAATGAGSAGSAATASATGERSSGDKHATAGHDRPAGAKRAAGARIQRRQRRMVAFSKPRHPTMPTRHLHVANTGPAVGVSVETLWRTFSEYGPLERVVVELPQRAYLVVTFEQVADAQRAMQARDRPAGAGSIVKVRYGVLPHTHHTAPYCAAPF